MCAISLCMLTANDPKPTWRGTIYYILAALFLLYEMGVQSSPSVMARPIMHEFDFTAAVFGMAMGVYFYSYTLMQLPAGLVYDRLSAKWVIFSAVVICTVGTCIFYTASTPFIFSVARVVTGLGSAFAFVGVLVIAAKWFPARHYALLVGIAQMLAAIGAMAGEIPLAWSISHVGWRNTVAFLAVIGVLLAILILMVMRDPKHQHEIDNQRQPATQRSLLASVKAVFVQRQTYWIALYAFCSWAPITLFAELWGVPYLMVRFHLSNVQAAVGTAVIWISLALVSPLLGWMSDRLGRRVGLLQWCALIGLITSTIVLFAPLNHTAAVFCLLIGMGIAAAGQILTFALVRDLHSKENLAFAVGFNNVAVVIGGAIFQPAVGWLLTRHAQQSHAALVHVYSVQDYTYALAVIPFLYALGLIVSRVFIKDTLLASISVKS